MQGNPSLFAGLGQVGKIPDLRNRILFTLGMLAVYRLGIFVTTPGVDAVALHQRFESAGGSLFGLINLFSGGALERFSIFALGLTPYISVSIIIQILTPAIPTWDALKKEGEAGQRILTRYTRQGTLVLAMIQALIVAIGLEKQGVVVESGLAFRLSTVATLAAGTAFLMWVGEQITERGIGNGVSMLIFAGIVARMPQVLFDTIQSSRTGQISALGLLFVLGFCLLSVASICYVERSYRRIPIQYPRRIVGKNVAQAPTQYMPLKVNMTGVIPPIFASALLGAVGMVLLALNNEQAQIIQAYLRPGQWIYELVFVTAIFVFAYFYSSVIFNPTEMAENLKKRGGFIPSVRPGKQTADFLYGVLNRLTFWGALYIAAVCVLPQLVYLQLGTISFSYVFGGTAVLIAVGVTLDTASQIETHLVAKNYEQLMSRSSRIKAPTIGGARGRLVRR